MEAGFDPDAFWHQTERSFCIAVDGAMARLEREIEAQKLLAWNTAALAGAAFTGKLKPFADCFRAQDDDDTPSYPAGLSQENANLLSTLFRLKARGVPVTIERLDRKKLN